MDNNKLHKIANKVRHTSSTKSEKPFIRRHEYQPSLENRYTIQQRKEKSKAESISIFDQRKKWCENLKAKIREAQDQLKSLVSFQTPVKEDIRIIQAEIQPLQQSLIQLNAQGDSIARKLKNEKNQDQAAYLELQAQINSSRKKGVQTEIKEAKTRLKQLIQESDNWQNMIQSVKQFISQKYDLFIKEKFPLHSESQAKNK